MARPWRGHGEVWGWRLRAVLVLGRTVGNSGRLERVMGDSGRSREIRLASRLARERGAVRVLEGAWVLQ